MYRSDTAVTYLLTKDNEWRESSYDGSEFEKPQHRYRCKECRGTGRVPGITKTQGKSMGSAYGPCPNCDGIGRIENS